MDSILKIFCDVDDTVCHSTKPATWEMLSELNRLINLGHTLIFISGSTVDQIYAQTKGLGGEYHLLGTSGTIYVKVINGVQHYIYSHGMTSEQRSKARMALAHIIVKHDLPSVPEQLQDRFSQVTLSAIGRNADSAAKKAFDPDGSKRRAWIEELKQELGDEYSIKLGGSTSIDITLKGIDKGWGVREIIAHNKWDVSDCIFYGDKLMEGGNDYAVNGVIPCVPVTGVDDTLERFRNDYH
jgi:HAD superfamily hydrolase (TIGR01484 family)